MLSLARSLACLLAFLLPLSRLLVRLLCLLTRAHALSNAKTQTKDEEVER